MCSWRPPWWCGRVHEMLRSLYVIEREGGICYFVQDMTRKKCGFLKKGYLHE